jgi:putative hydrolase
MKLVADTHTHTLSSGHAYSTITENATQAKLNGMDAIAMTDHGPAMRGAATVLHFVNLDVIPEYIEGVRIFKGVEANIMDFAGRLDIPDAILARLEFCIASFHDLITKPGNAEENTEGMVNAICNPFVDAVGHPGNPAFQVDIDKVVRAAAEHGKLIELNNGSFRVRKGSRENCLEFVRKCKKYGVSIACGTDAHISYDIGKFENILDILSEIQMPEGLIINTDLSKLENYIRVRRTVKKATAEAWNAVIDNLQAQS